MKRRCKDSDSNPFLTNDPLVVSIWGNRGYYSPIGWMKSDKDTYGRDRYMELIAISEGVAPPVPEDDPIYLKDSWRKEPYVRNEGTFKNVNML
jgi:hypothetical protein